MHVVFKNHFFLVVPNGNSPYIVHLNSYKIGSYINLTCVVNYANTDIATNINIKWSNSFNHMLHSYTGLNDYTEHTLNYTISNVKLSDAGQYTCQYNVSSNNHLFVLASDVMIATTNVSIKS